MHRRPGKPLSAGGEGLGWGKTVRPFSPTDNAMECVTVQQGWEFSGFCLFISDDAAESRLELRRGRAKLEN